MGRLARVGDTSREQPNGSIAGRLVIGVPVLWLWLFAHRALLGLGCDAENTTRTATGESLCRDHNQHSIGLAFVVIGLGVAVVALISLYVARLAPLAVALFYAAWLAAMVPVNLAAFTETPSRGAGTFLVVDLILALAITSALLWLRLPRRE
jgi:hypothetical protein